MPDKLLIFLLLIEGANAACSDNYGNFVCPRSNPSLLLTKESTTFSCGYQSMTAPESVCLYDQMSASGSGPAPPMVSVCNLTCPGDSELIAYLPDFGCELHLVSANFDSVSWKGTQLSPAGTPRDMGNNVQFGCLGQSRCGPYIDDTGTLFPTRCNVADTNAKCNEDITQLLCTCTPGWTGPTCSLAITMLEEFEKWASRNGPEFSDKLMEIIRMAQRGSPAALVDILPLLYSFLSRAKKMDMSWSLEEMIDSIDYELKEVDSKVAFTQVFDDVLGNCYTFNYANKTNSFDGLYNTRFAGQGRDFSVMVKLDPVEQVAWIECTAISAYIHAPGTPPTQGILYSLRADASDVIALQKTITKLKTKCITSRNELKQNYYMEGDYTTDGCYSACYQDKVLEKCGCMDARYKKSDTAAQCSFKENDCIIGVTAEYGEPSNWPNCKCPNACYQEVYKISSTRAALPFKIPTCANVTDGCPDLSQTLARLTIYMETLESQVYVEMEKMTLTTFLSQFGGQMGFLLGMSIVGILEIFILCGQLGKDTCSTKKTI